MDFETVRAREAAHFLPGVRRVPVAIAEGKGVRVRDVEGREYVDLTAGWGVTCLGHAHPALAEAICAQAGRLLQTTNLFYTLPQLDLAERLAALAPAGLTRSFVVSSGSEAVEGAVKLAHRASGRTGFVSARGGFHGRTLGALRLNGSEKHRAPYRALLAEPTVVPYGDLEAARAAVDGSTCAVVVEPVQGEGGVRVPPEGYLRGLREICDAAGALLVVDEIQTGVGRTGRMFACEHEGVRPDVMTLGKGLGGGFPVAAFLTTEEVAATVRPGDHGGTYAGNPLACAAANAVLAEIEKEGLVERAAALGSRLRRRLEDFAAAQPERVAEVRGRGLLLGMELRDAELAGELPRRAAERGVLVNVTAGTVLRLFPALNASAEEVEPALETVLEVVAER